MPDASQASGASSPPQDEVDVTTRSRAPSAIHEEAESAPDSPRTATRTALRNLTLPTVPNLDIPPSPPGSPPPGMNEKVKQFLDLKKQGIHFNEKLANSSAIKNPSLLSKLMTFAGLDHGEQYATTLPTHLWDPEGFPPWAYRDELAKAQQEAQRKREDDRSRSGRSAADFVTSSRSEQSSRSGTPGGRVNQSSAAERVMAGLSRDKEKSNSTRDRNDRRRSRSPDRKRQR